DIRAYLEAAGPRPEISVTDLEAIRASARSAWEAELRRHHRARATSRTIIALAAGVAIVAIGIGVWLAARPRAIVVTCEAVSGTFKIQENDGRRAIIVGETIRAGSVLSTDAVNGHASFRTASGAILRLDAGTRARLDSRGVIVLEQGAVYVDSDANPDARLEVRTPAGVARDIGTQFVVRVTGPAPSTLQIRVREGSVAVERDGRKWLAPAGRELIVRADLTAEMRNIEPLDDQWMWVLQAAPQFDVEGRTLQAFLEWMSRETGLKIRYEDDALAAGASSIVLHGSIGEVRADQAPFVVLPGAGLEGEIREGVLNVRRAR
ncbi:MAG: FecR domain-containing protein, partial [Thermoanaerobaculia bacterium]